MFQRFRNQLANLLTGKNSMSIPQQFLRYGNRNPMMADFSDVVMSDQDHYSGYSYSAIKKRANAVARIAREFIKTSTSTDDKESVHPYIDLIKKSQDFSEREFWYTISTFLDLEGVYYLMVLRNSTEDESRIGTALKFKLLNPYNIQRIVNQQTLEVASYVETRKGLQRIIQPSMIIPIRELNPFSEDVPFAMTDAARESQYTLKSANDYTRHSLRSNANAPGIISTDIQLPDEKFKNFVARIKDATKGDPLFGNGSGAINWESMGIDLSKSALKDINEVNRDALLAASGLSKTMMGIEQSGTTRETANVQTELFIESEIVPRFRLIADALSMDYRRRYPEEYSKNEARISINNPIESDQDIEGKKIDNKTKNFELFDKLVAAGYDEDIAAQYANGEIELEELGKPTNEPRPDPKLALLEAGGGKPPTKPVVKKKANEVAQQMLNQSVVQDQESLLQNSIVNIDQRIVVHAIDRIPKLIKNTIDSESDLITKKEKDETINELIFILAAFYSVIATIQGKATMEERLTEFGLGGQYLLDSIAKKGIKETAKLVAKSHIDTISKEIYEIAREAAIKGESQQSIISLLKKKYNTSITEVEAKRIARTETNRAFTMAQYDADRQFIDQNELQSRAYKKYETRSANPCEFCLQLESEGEIPFDQPFRENGGKVTALVEGKEQTYEVNFESIEAGNLHPNCVLPDTKVIAPNVKKIIKSYYSGDIIKVSTVGGRILSVTPNHIVLTMRGWVAAKNLRKTDSIVSYSGWDEIGLTDADPNNKNSIATVEEVFTSLSKTSGMPTTSVPVASKDLKGDGAFCKGNVDIISTNGLLMDELNSSIRKSLTNHLLKKAGSSSEVSFIENGNLSSMLFALGLSSDGIMSSDSLSSLLKGGDLTVEKFHSLFKISDYNSRLEKASLNSLSISPEDFGNLIKTLTGIISSDDILNIDIVSYSGHIYDLSTVSTLYISNGLITSNCSCIYRLVIKNE